MKESSRKSPKITLDIKEYEEIIVIDDNTPATSLVSMLRQRAKNEKTRPNSRGEFFAIMKLFEQLSNLLFRF